MSRLERVTHKLFAENAPVVESGTTQVEIGQFGSALAGTYVATNDVATLQALPAYTRGWGGAVISENNFPTLEDMNAVQRVQSYQTGYLFQEGIAEYDENTEYGLGSLCKIINGTNVKIYQSLINENIGNPITDTSSWQEFTIGGDLYVSKSGDTMTGDLTIQKANGNVIVSGANGYKSFISNNKDLDYTSIDQINMYGSRVISNDKNGNWFAYNQHGVASNGNFYNNACVRRSINGTVKQAVLGITVNKSGYAFAEAPTPTATSNTTQIATTAWVRNYAIGYPDYSRGVNKSYNTTYTADQNGFVFWRTQNVIRGEFYVNEFLFADGMGLTGSWADCNAILVPVSKNDTYQASGGTAFVFYPLK